MVIHEIQVSRTEIFTRNSVCDDWVLRVGDGWTNAHSILMEVPPSSILRTILDMLALTLEYFEVDQTSEKVSVETTLRMLNEGKAVLAATILSNQARIKGN